MLNGTVKGRAKRVVGTGNIELVTYKIAAGGREYYVKDWKPEGAYLKVGEKVTTPVVIKIYQKNGQTSLDYSIQRGSAMIGEAF